jgi:L-rhamnose-H+ transport protein
MNGSFTMPMKWMRLWAWENVWLLWAVFALVVFPITSLILTVRHPFQVYHEIGIAVVAVIVACGIGLGLCQVCFGLSVDLVGVALTFAIASGVAAAVGSIAPLIIFHRERVLTRSGAGLLAGVILVVCGVAFCAVAGRRREAALHILRTRDQVHMVKGLSLAVASGVTAASMNIGFDFATKVIVVARSFGTPSLWATNVVWVPMLFAASIPNVFYCLYLLRKRQTVAQFRRGSFEYWASPILMAALWYGGIVLYGLSTTALGTLGAVLGWPLLESVIVITASVLGVVAGEWQGSGRGPVRLQFEGVAILIAAVFMLSAATM